MLNYGGLSLIGKRGNFWLRGGVYLSAALAAVVAWSQDDPDFATANPDVPSLPVAQPVATPVAAPVAAPIPNGRSALPPQMSPGSAAPGSPGTGSFSGFEGQSRLIEVIVPERVPVYPDDPESAWWEVNPHVAFDRAQREFRPLLLVFTGTWNAQAMSLSKEVFATKSFNEFTKENLVICYLSYPKNFTDASPTLQRIKEKFKVKGYPNTLIFNPNGEVEKGITGYRTGRAIDYFNRLKAACLPVIKSVEARRSELVKYGFRNWSNDFGTEMYARFIEHDHLKVVLQDGVGQKWTVSKRNFSSEDQKFVETFPAVDKLESEIAE